MDTDKIADKIANNDLSRELLVIAKLITAKTYGHTLWINSKVIDMGSAANH